MNEGEIRMQAQMYALVAEMHAFIAEMEGMKAENEYRIDCGNSIEYGEDSFIEISKKLYGSRNALNSL